MILERALVSSLDDRVGKEVVLVDEPSKCYAGISEPIKMQCRYLTCMMLCFDWFTDGPWILTRSTDVHRSGVGDDRKQKSSRLRSQFSRDCAIHR